MTICSFVGDEYLKNIFYLSVEEAVKHPDYDKYIRVLSKAIKDEEISLTTVESHLIGIAMTSTLRRKIIQDLKDIPFLLIEK
jgi:hypothetical protein|nr:hypothetical protein [Ruminococcus bromii]